MKCFFALFLLFALPVISLASTSVDINTASLSQLDELTGIGPVYAQRIIDNRPYSSIDDLDRVKGIGPATLQKIKDQGLACINCQMTTPPTLETTPTPTPTPTPTLPPTLAVVYPSGIFINEIMPNPEGPDETDEWLELYNSNNFEVDLSGWQIKDSAGNINTFIIPQETQILSNNFLVFKRPETKIMLNNEEDGLNLLNPNGKIVDDVSFSKAPLNQSYNKNGSTWNWSINLTPGAVNIVATATAKLLPKTQKVDNNSIVRAGLADISQSALNQENISITNPWFLFFIVLAVTVILSIIVLFIKFKLKNHVRT